MKLFQTIPLYVLIYKNRVKVHRLDNGNTIDKKAVTPFSNSRIAVANFENFEEFLKSIIKSLYKKESIFAPTFKILGQQMELNEDGLSQVEKRALRDSFEHIDGKAIEIMEKDYEISQSEALRILNNL